MNKVYLVGAGPGDPQLLTIRAIKILKKADVVLYDRLVDKRIIKIIPKQIKKIPVGKKVGEDSNEKQNEIHKLIKKYYKLGKNVVRLKGGDPFLFGRGGEEIIFMKKENIRFKVIPGITSAIGIPTLIGLPLTHRDYSSSVIIVPGHLKEGKEIDWKKLAEFDGTLVILMGASKIMEIAQKLIMYGMDPMTPVCAIMNGSKKGQKIVISNLKDISGLKAPAVIVIGKVVNIIDKSTYV
ncbi:MAG: uroporphyrinogen-III C-methyltransferase [Thermoplasmata archaeon]